MNTFAHSVTSGGSAQVRSAAGAAANCPTARRGEFFTWPALPAAARPGARMQ